jgi:hypothetical protein
MIGAIPTRRRLGYVRKLVVSGLGCACKKKTLGRLGQDDFDPNFGIPSGLIVGGDIATVPATVDYPASPSSGLTYVPTSAIPVDSSQYGTTSPTYDVLGTSGAVAQLSLPGATMLQTALGATSPLSSVNVSTLFLGGAAILLVALIASSGGSKRR